MLKPAECPRADPQALLRQGVGAWDLLFHALTARTRALNPSGVAIWTRLDGAHAPQDIAQELDLPVEAVSDFIAGLRADLFLAENSLPEAHQLPAAQAAWNCPAAQPEPEQVLTDGPAWCFRPGAGRPLLLCPQDERAGWLLDFFARSAGLEACDPPFAEGAIALRVRSSCTEDYDRSAPQPGRQECILPATGGRVRAAEGDSFRFSPHVSTSIRLGRVSTSIARLVQPEGGLLLHGAVLSGPTGGVLLCGASGVGKSTAARRLALPWRALGDDCALLTRAPSGAYLAQPMPTWSRFFGEEAEGRPLISTPDYTWETQTALPLRAIFLLEQAAKVRIQPVEAAAALCALNDRSLEVSQSLLYGRPGSLAQTAAALPALQTFHLERFANLCALVQSLPVYCLSLNLTDHYWERLEGDCFVS